MERKQYNRLSEVLHEKGMTQQDLADKLGVSQQAIQKVCSNRSQMSVQRMYTVADILGVNVCDLLVSNTPPADDG